MVRFVNGVPTNLYLSAHDGGAAYTFDAVSKMSGRPITYIAYGTHANYASTGEHNHDLPFLDDQSDAGHIWDVTKNFRGYFFDPSSQTFTVASGASNGATEEAGEGIGWLTFQGRWGDEQLEWFDDGQWCITGTECKYVDGPQGQKPGVCQIHSGTHLLAGPISKNLGRTTVCQHEDDGCDIQTSV